MPHLGGRVSPAWPHLRGAWVGLHWNVSEASLFRAMLEGVALEYTLYRDAARRLQEDFVVREIRITGGGEKSAAWNQLKADRLQARVVGIERGGGARWAQRSWPGWARESFRISRPRCRVGSRLAAASSRTRRWPISRNGARRYAELLAVLHQWTVGAP